MKTLSVSLSELIIRNIQNDRKRILSIGIITLSLGLAGAYISDTTTIATTTFFGMIFIFGGLISTVEVFASGIWVQKLLNVFVSTIYYFSGSIILLYPTGNEVWLTLFLSLAFVMIGIFRVIIGSQFKNDINDWDWLLFQGFLNFIIGNMIYFQLPVSGLWSIGMFISIEVIMLGLNSVFFASNIES